MVPDSSSPADDDDAGCVGFSSFRGEISSSIRSKAICPLIAQSRVLNQTSAAPIDCVLCFRLFPMRRIKKAWSRETELKLGMTLKFVQQTQRISRRFIEGSDLDRLRLENRFGYRKPRLALEARTFIDARK